MQSVPILLEYPESAHTANAAYCRIQTLKRMDSCTFAGPKRVQGIASEITRPNRLSIFTVVVSRRYEMSIIHLESELSLFRGPTQNGKDDGGVI